MSQVLHLLLQANHLALEFADQVGERGAADELKLGCDQILLACQDTWLNALE